MFHDIRSMRDAIERVENVSDENAFEHAISDLRIYETAWNGSFIFY